MAPGVCDSLRSGYVIGLPPVMNYAKVFINLYY